MVFEYDDRKSESNLSKHGIDFEEGKKLWEDPSGLIFNVQLEDEIRFALLSVYKSKHWTAIYTLRDEKVRIISIRRSRKKEVVLYESGRI